MTQFLLSDESGLEPEQPTHKAILDAVDKQQAASEIDGLVATGLTYLEATSRWMEERSIPENMFVKYVPSTIVEKIKIETIEDGLLRPSMTKVNTHSSLEFMYG